MNEKQKIILVSLAVLYLAGGAMFVNPSSDNFIGFIMMYMWFGVPAAIFYIIFGVPEYKAEIQKKEKKEQTENLFETAKAVLANYIQASYAFLQKKLSVSYAKAVIVINQLEKDGIINRRKRSGPKAAIIKNFEEPKVRKKIN
ncbi:MAG: hypothetical protein A2857_06075 [Candidatus Levybacteria bacterium RIFCSPHIGHO2_01_FULL_36_15]|nr:MAG: hypothetical protein A2857_06075 [Candidatus Levybacteria bacterium RIFCSPHIGHO2_01_FULL_36_15]